MDGIERKRVAPQQQARAASSATQHPRSNVSRKLPWVFVAVLVAVLITAICVWWFVSRPTSQVNQDGYQIVYMTTGQAYFGKLVSTSGEFFVLENVYVTQAQDLPENASDQQKQATEANTSLIKVTNQVYGPDDQMQLRADNVLFWQNLSDASKVSEAIRSAQ